MAPASRTDRRSTRLAVEPLENRVTPAAGFLDTTFGTGGREVVAFPANGTFQTESEANAIAVQGDGKIVMVGRAPNLSVPGADNLDWAVVRLNPDGTLDNSFGSGGRVQVAWELGGNNNDEAKAVAIQPDGRIVVGGYATRTGSGSDFALARFNTNGTLDTSFGVGGKSVVDFATLVPVISAGDEIDDLVLQPDGKIIAAGFSTFNGFAVARFNANGVVDGSFNKTGGNAVFGSIFEGAHGVALQGNKIVVVGTTGLTGDMGAARFNADGTLDGSFASGGKFQAGFSGGTGRDVLVQPNGQIVLGGSGKTATTSGRDFAVVRLNANGSLDGSFGPGGVVTVGINLGGGNNDDGTAVLYQGGKIIVTGTANPGGGRFASARLNPDGSLDGSYGAGGVNTYFIGTQYIFGTIEARDAALNPDGTILIAGTNSVDMIALRLTNDASNGTGNPGVGGGITTAFFAAAAAGPLLAGFSNGGVGPYNPNASVAPDPTAVFPGFGGTVRTAVADVDGDGIPDFAMVTGPGTPTRFAVVSGADLVTQIVPPTFPFRGSEAFDGGGFISVGSLGAAGGARLVISPDVGGGPRVVVFAAGGVGAPPVVQADFFGITDSAFRGGARTAIGDVNGDGIGDLVVAAGVGGGPRVSVYDGSKLLTTRAKVVTDFFAFGGADATNLRNGVYVAVGDVDGDGFGDIIAGAGPGGGPRVVAISGKTLMTRGALFAVGLPLADFFSGDPESSRGGVRVAVKNVDGDNLADLVTGTGDGTPGVIRTYVGTTIQGRNVFPVQEFGVFGTDPLADGVYVG